jgi:type IV secretion system protein VirD4
VRLTKTTTTEFVPPRGADAQALPSTGKQSLPSAHFQPIGHVKRNPVYRYGGSRLFLGRIDDNAVGLADNRHIVTIGGSRSGKSACALIPNLLLYPGSALVLDPKGELAEATAEHRRAVLNQRVVVLDPFEITKGDAATLRAKHDPLREIDIQRLDGTDPDLIDDAAILAEALVIETGGDAHWTMAARNLIVALLLFARLGNESMTRLHEALSGDPKPLWHAMAVFGAALDETAPSVVRDACALIRAQGDSFLHKSDREAPIIVSSALEQLSFLRSPKMKSFLDGQGVDLSDLIAGPNDQPVTIYLVLPAGRMGTHNRWLRAIVTLALNHFERSPAPPAIPILLILEEFAALEHLRPIERAAGFIAGAGVRLWIVLQDLTQLQRHYKEGWETFIGNAGIIQAFSLSDLTTCKYLSERLGETTLEVTNKEPQSISQIASGVPPARREFRTTHLLTPAEIALTFARRSVDGRAAGGLALVITPEDRPFVVERVHWTELKDIDT